MQVDPREACRVGGPLACSTGFFEIQVVEVAVQVEQRAMLGLL